MSFLQEQVLLRDEKPRGVFLKRCLATFMLKEERGGNCHISLSNTRQPKEKMKASVFCQQEPVSCQLKRNLLCEEGKTRGKNMPRNTTSILEFAFPQMVFRFSFNVTWRKKLTDSVSFLFDRRDKDNVSRFSQHVRTHRFTRLECDVIERVRMQMNIQVCGWGGGEYLWHASD